jgi:hypothetical protein
MFQRSHLTVSETLSSRVPTPPSASRIRRTVLTALAGAGLLLLGVACDGAAPGDEPNDDAATAAEAGDNQQQPLVALTAAHGPIAEGESAPIEVTIEQPGAEPIAGVATNVSATTADVTPPGFAITSPVPGSKVNESYWLFQGVSEPGATIAAGPFETVADEKGHWSIALVLNVGQNVAVLTATDEAGNATEKTVTVSLEDKLHDKKDGSHKETGSSEHDFSAYAKYGVCQFEPFAKVNGGDDHLADGITKFKGWATTGTNVTVTTPYASGSGVAGADGYWYVKLDLSSAPDGAQFVASATDGATTYQFNCTG